MSDCPSWEKDDPFQPTRSVPRGYLDYLTWYARRILLIPENTSVGLVVNQIKFTQGMALRSEVLDSMKQYIASKDKQRLRPLSFHEEQALWRDSTALFQLGMEGYRPPKALYWLSELVDEGYLNISQTRRYLALGMATKPGQAKVDFYRSELMPLPLAYLKRRELVEHLDTALRLVEGVSTQLWSASRVLALYILMPETQGDALEIIKSLSRNPRKAITDLTNQWSVERDYWSRLEIPFRQVLEALPDDIEGTLVAWRDRLRRTAWAAFERVANDLERDPRNLKATVRARDQLAAGLGKVLPATED